MTRVGFCGLGVMGYPMAGHLASAGHSVSVYNRTSSRADAWVAEHFGTAFVTPREVAANSDIVMLCVGNDADVVRRDATGFQCADGCACIIVVVEKSGNGFHGNDLSLRFRKIIWRRRCPGNPWPPAWTCHPSSPWPARRPGRQA